MTDPNAVPREPICKHPDGTPCKYAGKCSTRSQKIRSGIIRGKLGQDVEVPDLATPIDLCWHFQFYSDGERDPSWQPLTRPAA